MENFSTGDVTSKTLHDIVTDRTAIPVIGLPRSGKTFFFSKLKEKCSEEGLGAFIISADEFDGIDNDLADIVVKDLIIDDSFSDSFKTLNFLFSGIDIFIIDSIKNSVYSGSSLRKGGLSNNVFKVSNLLFEIARTIGKTVLYSVNTNTKDEAIVEEIITLFSGCSKSLILINNRECSAFLHNVDNARSSNDEIINIIGGNVL